MGGTNLKPDSMDHYRPIRVSKIVEFVVFTAWKPMEKWWNSTYEAWDWSPKNWKSGKNHQNKWKGPNQPYLGWGKLSKKEGGMDEKFWHKNVGTSNSLVT